MTFVVRAVAPNEAAWDVNLRVAGGSPSIGAAPEADRLVVETPNLAGGLMMLCSIQRALTPVTWCSMKNANGL